MSRGSVKTPVATYGQNVGAVVRLELESPVADDQKCVASHFHLTAVICRYRAWTEVSDPDYKPSATNAHDSRVEGLSVSVVSEFIEYVQH